jgi:hypothetical protein
MLMKQFDQTQGRAYIQNVFLTIESPGTLHRSKSKFRGTF